MFYPLMLELQKTVSKLAAITGEMNLCIIALLYIQFNCSGEIELNILYICSNWF